MGKIFLLGLQEWSYRWLQKAGLNVGTGAPTTGRAGGIVMVF